MKKVFENPFSDPDHHNTAFNPNTMALAWKSVAAERCENRIDVL